MDCVNAPVRSSVLVLLLTLALAGCARTLPPAPVTQGDRVETAPPASPASVGIKAPEPKAGQAVRTARLVPPAGRARPPAGQRTVRVRAGDNLYVVARRHGVSLRALIEANRLRAPFRLTPGQRLVLPAPRFHLVKSGDTVYGVSRKYGVHMTALVRLNRIKPPYRIPVGRKLLLPGVGKVPVRTASRSPPPPSAPPGRQAVDGGEISAPKLPLRRRLEAPPVRRTRPIAPPPPRSAATFLWPVRGRILIRFGPRAGGLHNDGINIAARAGSPVRAAENGIVAYAGNELEGFGNLLVIRHAGGWITAYAHMRTLQVRRGDRVRRGQTVARVGSTGNVTRPQLHFEIRKGDEAVNPEKLLVLLSHRPVSVAGRGGRPDPG
jgi:murein DD-endopeptidase MepM/ murein hydrolase activator NlpD